MSKYKKFEILKKTTLAKGFFTFNEYLLKHELFAGGWSPEIRREVIEKGNAVALLLYDPTRDAVLMIEQFRIGAIHTEGKARPTPWVLELVAGLIEPGETELDVAQRETLEEANTQFSDYELITKYYPNPSSMPECISLYCAKIDSRNQGGIYGLAEEGEDIKVHVISVEEAYRMMESGEINSAAPIIALLWLQLNSERLKKQWS